MLSIQKFAKLCQCSTQTLRYYDKENILKPYFVEKVSGYRYYLALQAIDFQKIKELQGIGCSIEEIKALHGKSDDEILMVIEKKMQKQREQLEKTIAVKQTYLNKKMKLEKQIETLEDLERIEAYEKNGKLCLKQDKTEVVLNIQSNVPEVVRFLNTMQEKVVIGFENLQDFQMYEHHIWHSSEIFENWRNIEELIPSIPQVKEKLVNVMHMFYITENITLFDIANMMDHATKKGFTCENNLFNVSLSTDLTNRYVILYTEE